MEITHRRKRNTKEVVKQVETESEHNSTEALRKQFKVIRTENRRKKFKKNNKSAGAKGKKKK